MKTWLLRILTVICLLVVVLVSGWWVWREFYSAEQLEKALRSRDYARAERLVAWGADVNTKNEYGMMPLHYAAMYGSAGIARVLLNAKADVDAKDASGETPLHYVAINGIDVPGRGNDVEGHGNAGHLEIAKMLLNAGANINARDEEGVIPLAKAVSSTNLGMVSFFIEHGADIYAKDNRGFTVVERPIYFNILSSSDWKRFHTIKHLVKSVGGDVPAR